MKRENRRNILVRYGVIVFFILILSARIVYKLVDNTVVSADKWNAKAEQTLANIDTIQPVRGDILAADGSVLATNMIVYTPMLDFRVPRFKEKDYRQAVPELADSMARYFPHRTAEQWRQYLLKPLQSEKAKRPRAFPLLAKASNIQVEQLRTFPFLREKKLFTGFHVDKEMQRVRPYGDMARRSIGATGFVGGKSTKQGIYGLEKALDSLLAGKPGVSKKVRLTNAIVDWTDLPPVDGYNVLTTIDIKMQDIVENELNKILEVCQADWGTAVLMEVGTGDIKAIANLELSPSGDGGYSESLNYAVRRYEPGSVVKTLSLLVAMEDGRIPNLNKVYKTGASFTVGGRATTDCSKSDTLSLRRALEMSSNIVMSRMILEAYGDDPGRFYNRVRATGFLEPFRTGIAEEVIPRIDSLKKTDLVSLTRQSFGYGTEISPLYTCALYNAIAGGGKFVRPRLVRGLRGNGVDSIFPVSYVRERICSEQNARELRDMLHRVVWGPRGTARSVLRSEKVDIAGKTGTANKIENGQYVKGRNRLSFCGFFPYQNPRYTCMVIVAYPRQTLMSPATTSGQVVKNVAEAMYARGMLGNTSDYRKTESPVGEYPTYYASLTDRPARIHSAIGGGPKGVMNRPADTKGGVPSVIGLSLRDALNRLEQKGYNVSFSGTGYVSGQTPGPGVKAKPGSKVVLQLRQ